MPIHKRATATAPARAPLHGVHKPRSIGKKSLKVLPHAHERAELRLRLCAVPRRDRLERNVVLERGLLDDVRGLGRLVLGDPYKVDVTMVAAARMERQVPALLSECLE